jgi:hypothetical protein
MHNLSKFALALGAMLVGCDGYNPATSFGGDSGTGDADEHLPNLAPGEDVCWLIAAASELSLVDSHGLAFGSPPDDMALAPDGSSATYSTVNATNAYGAIWTWDLTPYDEITPRRLFSPSMKFARPLSNRTRSGTRAVVWTATDGPSTVHVEGSGLVDWDAHHYASLGGGYRVGVADLGFVDDLPDGVYTIELVTAVSRLLGSVRATMATVKAAPPLTDYYTTPEASTVVDAVVTHYSWLPYGGVCYLGLPSGLDGGSGG